MKKITQEQIKEFMDVIHKTRKVVFEMRHCTGTKKMGTALQMRGLMMLSKNPGVTVGELADRFMMSSAAVAQYLNRLEKAGLIDKKTDEKDKRISRIFVSAKGQKELEKMQTLFTDKLSQVLAPLSKEELDTLIALHKKILDHLEGDSALSS